MSQERDPDRIDHEHVSPLGQLVKFGLLALVLIGAVFAVMLARPLIFDQIVPAVLGLDGDPAIPPPPPIPPGSDDLGYPGPAPTVEATIELGGTPTVVVGETAVPAVEITPTATSGGERTHTVQAGENLSRIARAYGVTVQDIVAANNISDPDRVVVGTVLIIPPTGEDSDDTIFVPISP